MPGNHEGMGGGAEAVENAELTEKHEREADRRAGAKVLAGVGFQDRQKEIVDSSLQKMMARGEKLTGKNAERRNLAYVSRLENLVEKYGNKLERKLWDASTDKLVIRRENIEDSYWDTQEQILRDNGQGRELSDYEKDMLTEDIQQKQRESLESWSNYLGDEQTPYPMWFKVYAWDGMSKMGVFDKKKGEFRKRDEHTVAPYPHLNAAALGKVYEAIGGEGVTEEDAEKQEKLEKLTASKNFNKLYSHFLLNQKVIIKTPERTEDVKGVWKEYLPGDEDELAVAAEGTPWCVASPAVGRNYLETGNYGEQDVHNGEESKAKFILFHLADPDTGEVAENANASIRLGLDGRVAEISGVNGGQALEDALVPIVEEKVKTLPGGEEFLEAFADKKRLIELDRKMQEGGEMTLEDVNFIFGDIKVLDTYNTRDPRVDELQKYVLDGLTREKADELGVDPTELIEKMSTMDVDKRFDQLLELGVSPAMIMKQASGEGIGSHFEQLLELGIDPTELTRKMDEWNVDCHFGQLLELGVDPTMLMTNMSSKYRDDRFDQLLELGVSPAMMMGWMRSKDVSEHFDQLVGRGVNLTELVRKMDGQGVDDRFDQLVGLGVDPTELVKKMSGMDIGDRFEQLLELGVDPIEIVKRMSSGGINEHLSELLELGVDLTEIVKNIDHRNIGYYFDRLLELGADPTEMAKRMSRMAINERFDQLLELGVDPVELIKRIDERNVDGRFDRLLELGVDPTEIAKAMTGIGIDERFDQLLELGVNMTEVSGKMYADGTERHFDQLMRIDPVAAARVMPAEIVIEKADQLVEHGVDLVKDVLPNWSPEDIDDFFDQLVELGIDSKVVSQLYDVAVYERDYGEGSEDNDWDETV